MQWLEFKIDTTHEAADVIVDYLSSLGADGVQVEDSAEIIEILQAPDSLTYADDDFLNNLDPVVHIKAYFAKFDQGVRRNKEINLLNAELYDDMPKIFVEIEYLEQTIKEKLSEIGLYLDTGTGYLGFVEVKEEDWADNWKKYYSTIKLSDRIVINPSWIDYEASDGEIVISLDPGSAFGTGSHETTAMCALMLDKHLKKDDKVLDLGCGSGVLAIIAAKLGCTEVEAIDIDSLAVNVAIDNCQKNKVKIDCHQGELKNARGREYTLIVANIIADIISQLAGDFGNYLSEDGLLITSGIIKDKAPGVIAACEQAGFELVEQNEQKEWCAFLWQKCKNNMD